MEQMLFCRRRLMREHVGLAAHILSFFLHHVCMCILLHHISHSRCHNNISLFLDYSLDRDSVHLNSATV